GFLAFVVMLNWRRRRRTGVPSDARAAELMPSIERPGNRVSRWLRRVVTISWAGWAACILSLWVQYQVGVYDTIGWLWWPFAVVGFLSGVVSSSRSMATAWN